MATSSNTKTLPEHVLHTEEEAAAILRMSTSWLSKDRTGKRPATVPYIKLGRRVLYRRCDLDRLLGLL